MQNNILTEIVKHSFSKYVVFNRLPIVLLEGYFEDIVNNPYFVRAGIGKTFSNVSLMIDTYEGWQDISRSIISDQSMIRDIIAEGRKKIPRYEPFLRDFLNNKEKKYSNSDIIALIHKLHAIGIDSNRENALLNENLLDTDDPELLRELPEVRLEISERLISPLWDCYRKVIGLIHASTSVSPEILENLTSTELVSLLTGDQAIASRGTKNRPVAFVFINGNYSITTDQEARHIAEYLRKEDKDISASNEALASGLIAGKIAHKGKVSGKVVLLKESDYPNAPEILKNKKQYILVTPMTRPEIAAYFSEALAFVTDEGGITCHAAIVAREMNKPCIISTRFATKVLRDGEMVEVDADNGVVRIMK